MATFNDKAIHLPVIIVGAGISGLLVAQLLQKSNISFMIFERDIDLTTRGAGWALTLQSWALEVLQECIAEDIMAQLPSTYVDRVSVESGLNSVFPFYDLTTGERKGASPAVSMRERVRINRGALRELLATGLDIQWRKAFKQYSVNDKDNSMTVFFEDGSSYRGSILIACDGSHSKVRHQLLPASQNQRVPVSLLGLAMRVTKEQAKPIRNLDPFFLQGTASATDVFMYISLLQAPRDDQSSNEDLVYQICISGSTEKEPFMSLARHDGSNANAGYVRVIQKISKDWAEPFRSFLALLPRDTQVHRIDLDDFVPVRTIESDRVVLMGDAAHAMIMYRGEGANHAMVDVLEFKQCLLPELADRKEPSKTAVDAFQTGMYHRTRPAVLASRKACLDAHDWASITPKSPLVTKREKQLNFSEWP